MPENTSRGARPGSSVVASRMKTAFSTQTWSLQPAAGRPQCRAFFLDSGQAKLFLANGAEIELRGQSVAWIPGDLGREFRLDAGGSGVELSAPEEFVWRTMGDSAMVVDLKSLMDEVALAAGGNLPDDEVRISFASIVRESRQPEPGSASIVGFHLGLILLHLWRAIGARRSPAPFSGGGAALVQRFRQLVELHFREGMRIDDYAQRLGVTRGRLHDTCLRVERTPPLAIVHRRILEEAQRRLVQTEMSVEQVAYGLGFRDAPYFNRFFTRMTGVNPGAYRKAAISANPPVQPSSFAAWP